MPGQQASIYSKHERRRVPGNLGRTRLPKRRRNRDPMSDYDRLPAPLRRWLAEAVLPWSPASCRRIWDAGRQDGMSIESILQRLSDAEAKALERDDVFPSRTDPG